MTYVALRSICRAALLAGAVAACETPADYRPVQDPLALPAAQRPSFTPGDEFWFDRGDGSIFVEVFTGMDNGRLVFDRGLDNETRHTSPDLALVEVRRPFGADRRFDPDDGALEFPLTVGKTWTRSYRVRGSSERETVHRTRDCEVLDTGRADTPAGSFAAYRIVCTSRELGQASSVREEAFYAPEVGRIVLHRTLGGGTDLLLIEVRRAP